SSPDWVRRTDPAFSIRSSGLKPSARGVMPQLAQPPPPAAHPATSIVRAVAARCLNTRGIRILRSARGPAKGRILASRAAIVRSPPCAPQAGAAGLLADSGDLDRAGGELRP